MAGASRTSRLETSAIQGVAQDDASSESAAARAAAEWEWLGAGQPRVAVAGHSHRAAYRAAIREGLVTWATTLEPTPPKVGALSVPDPLYWYAAVHYRVEVLALAWLGNQHHQHFLLEQGTPLRLYDTQDGSGQIVPRTAISAIWANTLEGLPTLIGEANARRVVVVGTPPPKPDEQIRAVLVRRGHLQFANAVNGAVDPAPAMMSITPGSTRVGLWRILQSDLRRTAEEAGASFVPVPDAAMTAEGYLRDEFSADDPSHANGAFGALMLQAIIDA